MPDVWNRTPPGRQLLEFHHYNCCPLRATVLCNEVETPYTIVYCIQHATNSANCRDVSGLITEDRFVKRLCCLYYMLWNKLVIIIFYLYKIQNKHIVLLVRFLCTVSSKWGYLRAKALWASLKTSPEMTCCWCCCRKSTMNQERKETGFI